MSGITRICSRCKSAPPRDPRCGYCRQCETQYSKERRRSSGTLARPTDEESFWSRVKRSDGCWEWTGARSDTGYGATTSRRFKRAHRFSWYLANGPIPRGSWVLHRCDNRVCVNPAHLFLGDRKANVDDMVAKGRQALGHRNGAAKLDEAAVRAIRRLREGGETLRSIALKFGVNDMSVHYICKRVTWRHVV